MSPVAGHLVLPTTLQLHSCGDWCAVQQFQQLQCVQRCGGLVTSIALCMGSNKRISGVIYNIDDVRA